jgi:hypothetical protein
MAHIVARMALKQAMKQGAKQMAKRAMRGGLPGGGGGGAAAAAGAAAGAAAAGGGGGGGMGYPPEYLTDEHISFMPNVRPRPPDLIPSVSAWTPEKLAGEKGEIGPFGKIAGATAAAGGTYVVAKQSMAWGPIILFVIFLFVFIALILYFTIFRKTNKDKDA